MRKKYISPFVEFVRITGDALAGSTERKTENGSKNINDFNGYSDDYSDWIF
ncbi:MAG: hypothetical protein IJ725_04245 [Ruminococcus sp.]|nr:hypothetical protein [Ruminococcus sp.]